MAQWFKNFWRRRFQKKQVVALLDFNGNELKGRLSKLQNMLFEEHHEKTVKIVSEALAVAINMQILHANEFIRSGEAIAIGKHQGRVEAFTDFADWIRRAIDRDDYARRTKHKEPSGTANIADFRKPRRSGNQAGPAIG